MNSAHAQYRRSCSRLVFATLSDANAHLAGTLVELRASLIGHGLAYSELAGISRGETFDQVFMAWLEVEFGADCASGWAAALADGAVIQNCASMFDIFRTFIRDWPLFLDSESRCSLAAPAPDRVSATISLSEDQLRHGASEDAFEELTTVLAEWPWPSRTAAPNVAHSQCLKSLLEACVQAAQRTAEPALALAWIALATDRVGLHESSRDIYKNSNDICQNYRAHVGLGQFALLDGDLPQAMEHFHRAQSERPDAAEARAGLARTLMTQGQYREARLQLDAHANGPLLMDTRVSREFLLLQRTLDQLEGIPISHVFTNGAG